MADTGGLTFDDLIPVGEQPASAPALNFDDLIPERDNSAGARISDAFGQGEATAITQGQEATRDMEVALERSALGRGLNTLGQMFDDTFLENEDGTPNMLGRAANYLRGSNAREGEVVRQVGGPAVTAEQRAESIASLPFNDMYNTQKELLRQYDRQGFSPMKYDEVDGLGGFGQFVLENFASSAPQMGASITGGPFVSMALYTGEVNDELKRRTDLDPDTRIAIASGVGFFNSALESLGFDKMLGKFSPSRIATAAAEDKLVDLFVKNGIPRSVAKVLESSIVEGTTETLQEATTMAASALSGGQYTVEEVADRLAQSAAAGAAVGGGVRTTTAAFERDSYPATKPKPEAIPVAGADAAQSAALGGNTTGTVSATSGVDPDQAAALNSGKSPADVARDLLNQRRAQAAAPAAPVAAPAAAAPAPTAAPAARKPRVTDPMSDDFEAPGRKTPAPAPAADLTAEQRAAANQQAAAELNVRARPVVTPEVATPAAADPVTEQVAEPTEQVAAAPTAPTQGAAIQRTSGYEGPSADVIENRMARLNEIIADETKPERVRREAAGRLRDFEAYRENRDAMLDQNAVDDEQRAAVLSLVPDDIITATTEDDYTVIGTITGWAPEGTIYVIDQDGFYHNVMPHTVENIRRGARDSIPDMSPMDEALQFQPSQPQAAAPAATPEVTAPPVDQDGAIETVPETREQIDAQMRDMLDPKNARVAVFVPFGGYMPAKPDLGYVGKMEVKANRETGDEAGMIFYNSRKKLGRLPVGKGTIKILEAEGRRNELLGLGPYNKADLAARGGAPMAVVETNAEGTRVRETAAADSTVDEQAAAMEATKGEGSTVTVTTAEDVLNARQEGQTKATPEVTVSKADQAKATGKRRSKKAEPSPVRTMKDMDPEEIARIEAAANAKPEPKPAAEPKAPKAEESKAEAAKATSAKRTVVLESEATKQRAEDAYNEQAFLRKRAAAEEELRVRKEQELAAKKVELDRKIAENDFKDAEDEAVSRIEANRTEATHDAARDKAKIASAVKAGRVVEQLRATLQAVTGTKAGFPVINSEGDTVTEDGKEIRGDVNFAGAKTVAKQMRAILLEAKKAGVSLGRAVDDTVASPMAFLIDLRTQAVKLEKLPSIMDQGTRLEIMAEVNTAIQDLNAYLVGNDATGLRERRITEGGLASEGVGGVDFDSFADERSELDRDEETEDDPDAYELVPSNEPERTVEIDDSIPTFTAGQNKTVKVEVRKDRSAARAAAQKAIRDRMMLTESEKPLGKDSEKLVENLNPSEVVEEGVLERITFAGKPLGSMSVTERVELFKEMDGVNPMNVEASLAIAKLPLSRFQRLLEGPAFLRALGDNLKFMDKMPAAIQKALGTKLLEQMNAVAGDVEVYIVPGDMMKYLAPGKDGYFWPRGDYIVISNDLFNNLNAAKLQHTVTHEAGHAALWHAIRKNKDLARQLTAVLNGAKTYANRVGIQEFDNGLRNIDEFASELISNARFQEFLSTVTLKKTDLVRLGIKPSLSDRIRTALDAIKLKLMEAIGWQDALKSLGMNPDTPNALTAGMDIIGNLLETAPAARQEFLDAAAKSDAELLGMDSGTGIYGRLKQRGLDDEQAQNVAAMIDEEFGGTVTDEELDAIAAALGKPLGSQQGLTGPSPFMPPKLPSRVGKLFNRDPSQNPRLSKAILYASTLDFIDTTFRKYFGDKAGNALSDYVNAQFSYQKIAQDIAAVHDMDFADFEDLKRTKPQEAAKIQKLVGMLQSLQIDISKGATNDHLKKGNARKYLQSKKALPEVQALMASMDPETLDLVQRMAKNFTESFNDHMRAVTYTILEGLDTKLSNSDMMRIIDHTVNGKLDAQDKADINDDEVYAQLERSEFLRRRKGSYFPAQRFGNWVVLTTTKIQDPGITSVVTKSGKKVSKAATKAVPVGSSKTVPQPVPVTTEIDDETGTVRFIFDYGIRGSRTAVGRAVYNWVANHELPLQSYIVRYRDRQTGEIVGKGDMDVTRDYDMVHEVKLQNRGVHMFETAAEAKAFEVEADKDRAAGVLTKVSGVEEKHAESGHEHMIPTGALNAVFRSIDNNQSIKDQHRKQQMKNAVRDAMVAQMPGNRYEKRLLGRQNVIGASDEVGRAAAYYGRSVGNSIARIRSGGERAEALARMREIQSRHDKKTGTIVSMVVNEIVRREDLTDGPMTNNQLLDNLSTLNSVDKLLSPANWFLNGTQVPLNSLPYLGGRFGNVKAARKIISTYNKIGAGGALKSGLKNTGKAVTRVGKNRIDLDDVIGSIRKNAGVEYNDLFDSLIGTGDVTDDVGIENAAQLAAGRGNFGTALVKMDRVLRAMPNAIEAINRSTVAISAYDLARDSGMSKADSIAYAREALRRTQFRYDEANKSRLMRSNPALRFFFTFKQFGQGQYQMLADALSRALSDASPQERSMARKQLYTLFGMQFLTAGVFSLPAIELVKVMFMLGAALGMGDGWEEEVVDPLRAVARESFGLGWEEVVSKGLLSKVMGVDLSGRISWADLIVGYPPRSGEKEDVFSWLGKSIAGPQGAMVYEMFFQGPRALLEGDFAKGLNLMLPVKAVSDTVKAAGAVADGKMSEFDAAKQVLGFKSLRQARIDDEKGVRIRESGRNKKEVNDLIGDYLNAVSRGDVAKAAAAIRRHNNNLGPNERKISIPGLEKRRRENARRYEE